MTARVVRHVVNHRIFIMLERSLLVILYLTSLLMLGLMLVALYGEQTYLKSTDLLYLNPPVYHFLEWMIIFCLGFFVTTTLSLARLDKRLRFFTMAANYAAILLLQFLMIIYGSALISASISKYEKLWQDLSYSPAVATVESTMQCCGFTDTTMAISPECKFTNACGVQIKGGKSYRILKFLAMTISAVILQGWHAFALLSVKPASLAKQSDFDGLIRQGEEL